jgi:hypothetical protein
VLLWRAVIYRTYAKLPLRCCTSRIYNFGTKVLSSSASLQDASVLAGADRFAGDQLC